jgi:5-methylcytosine-specific restriction endonuclease McrA
MGQFEQQNPSLENYWRAVILFGRNVASYKFALAKSLIDVSESGKGTISYEELAVPFSKHITEHLHISDKQGTSSSSKFLSACRKFNNNELSQESLIGTTAKLGFVNVIDAFHTVNNREIDVRFFRERIDKGGIDLTDELYRLKELAQFTSLPHEIEARWRLVETAWGLNISRNLMSVQYDDENELLFTNDRSLQRINITSSRPALNGYQKGKCFYCFSDIQISSDSSFGTDVDHFFPHALKVYGFENVDGVWNLVLACYTCNRGIGGKSASLPKLRLLERLHTRNEFLINSHHPLRETLILQTGNNEPERRRHLNSYYNSALGLLIHTWAPPNEFAPAF